VLSLCCISVYEEEQESEEIVDQQVSVMTVASTIFFPTINVFGRREIFIWPQRISNFQTRSISRQPEKSRRVFPHTMSENDVRFINLLS
jgi:hypothetical protein